MSETPQKESVIPCFIKLSLQEQILLAIENCCRLKEKAFVASCVIAFFIYYWFKYIKFDLMISFPYVQLYKECRQLASLNIDFLESSTKGRWIIWKWSIINTFFFTHVLKKSCCTWNFCIVCTLKNPSGSDWDPQGFRQRRAFSGLWSS